MGEKGEIKYTGSERVGGRIDFRKRRKMSFLKSTLDAFFNRKDGKLRVKCLISSSLNSDGLGKITEDLRK